ncbi:MAG: hypothetical protein E7559_02095 [Ruminococcaceae bacterium]|nr:hypothetical protein [Oscillospiraceae bacterium]
MDIMTVFLKIFNMSIAASWLIAAVVILRLLLKKAPRWTICLLWVLVAVRLVCPFSIESRLSLVPSAEVLKPEVVQYEQHPYIDSGIPIINDVVNPSLGESFEANPAYSVNPLHVTVAIIGIVWLIGIAVMLLWAVFSYIRLRLKTREAVPLRGKVYRCDAVRSPFILGIIRPRIYIPSGISDETAEYVIAHEQAHLARLDHLWKPLGFLILSVYWFNPLCWAAYILLCRDIELACDEKVIGSMDFQQKKQYSAALLSCSTRQQLVTVCPLAFGEVGVKERIKSVLNYRKPAFWVIVAAVVTCAVAAVCFLTSPARNDQSPLYYKNIAAIAEQKSSLRITGEIDGIIDGKAFSAFIEKANWREKKYPSPLELAADLTVQVDENTRIRFYETEPRLAMILSDSGYRYYRMKNTDYNDVKSLVRTYEEQTADAPDWGVTLRTKDVTPTGLTLLIGQSGGSPTGELSTGSWYRIDVYDGIDWREAERLPMEHDVVWTAEGWMIQPGQQSEWKTDWSWLYGELPEGVYRICKKVMDWRAPGDFDEAVFCTEFVIGTPDIPEYIKASDTAAIPQEWNFSLRITDTAPNGVELAYDRQAGSYSGSLQAGDWFRVDRYDGVGWRECERLPQSGEPEWKGTVAEIKPNYTEYIAVDWSALYGDLPEGVYRICRRITGQTSPKSTDNITAETCAGFVIGSPALIPPLEIIFSMEKVELVLQGKEREELYAAWGEPASQNEEGDIWNTGVHYGYSCIVSVQYEENVVASVYRMHDMGTSPEHLIRRYSYTGEEFGESASVYLFDTGKFTFVFSPLSSYIGYGSYDYGSHEITGDCLTLYAANGEEKWVFTIVGDTLVYDGKASTGGNGFAGFEDGDVFE